MKIWQHRYFTWAVYTAVALLVSLQRLVMTARLSAEDLERSRTVYENYVIFKNAFTHLLAGLNPYAAYPSEQWDLFKYSPAFAVAMAPFAAVPDVIGLPAWNLLNALLPLSALWAIPVLSDQQRRFCAWFLLPELVISLQNSQSNGLTLGCMLWAYVAFEKGHLIKAAGWIAIGLLVPARATIPLGNSCLVSFIIFPAIGGGWTRATAASVRLVVGPAQK
jgi:hypothetical protein